MRRPGLLNQLNRSHRMIPRAKRRTLGDLDPSILMPFQTYKSDWQNAIASNNPQAAANAFNQASNLAVSLMNDSGAAAQTASILGNIASTAPLLAQEVMATGGITKTQADPEYIKMTGQINLLVLPSGQAGAISYLTNVDQATSTNNLNNLITQLTALQGKIGALQPGGVWNPAESFGAVTAEQIAPLQDELATILQTFNNSALTDADKATFNAAAQQVGDFLSQKSAAANVAGSAIDKPLYILAALTGAEPQNGAGIVVANEVNKCLEHPEQCSSGIIPQPFAFILKYKKYLLIGSGILAGLLLLNSARKSLKFMTFGALKKKRKRK